LGDSNNYYAYNVADFTTWKDLQHLGQHLKSVFLCSLVDFLGEEDKKSFSNFSDFLETYKTL